MTDDDKALGLRALAAGFRWAPGCLAMFSETTDPKEHRLGYWLEGWDPDTDEAEWRPVMSHGGDGQSPGWGWPAEGSGWWPDFSDPATLGVLRAQVRERWENPLAYCAPAGFDKAGKSLGWSCWTRTGYDRIPGGIQRFHGPTEAAALVAALEAAP